MAFDFKKEYKEFYLPPVTPTIVDVPSANYIAVRGVGNPNDEDSEYKASIELLYGIAYTIKMSKKGDRQIEGYFDFVVPPLEGLWWSEKGEVNYAHKEDFHYEEGRCVQCMHVGIMRFISPTREKRQQTSSRQ